MILNIVGHVSADIGRENNQIQYFPGGGIYFGLLALEKVLLTVQDIQDDSEYGINENAFDIRETNYQNITISGTTALALKFTYLFRSVIGKYKINKVVSKTQTMFENIYLPDRRIQKLYEIADSIPKSQVFNADIHILTPITQQDFGFDVNELQGIICLDIQGLVREVDDDKMVNEVFDKLPSFEKVSVLKLNTMQLRKIFNVESIQSEEFIQIPVNQVIVTDPMTIYLKYGDKFYKQEHQRYKNPTGHGDIILASYVLLQTLGFGPRQTLQRIVQILDGFFVAQ